MSIAEMAEILGCWPRTVVGWRRRLGFEHLDHARLAHLTSQICALVEAEPRITDPEIARRTGACRWHVANLRRRAGIDEYRVRVRAEIRAYLEVDPTMLPQHIVDGMQADGWNVVSVSMYTTIASVRRDLCRFAG